MFIAMREMLARQIPGAEPEPPAAPIRAKSARVQAVPPSPHQTTRPSMLALTRPYTASTRVDSSAGTSGALPELRVSTSSNFLLEVVAASSSTIGPSLRSRADAPEQ